MFKKVRQFVVENAQLLGKQLDQLESNVADEFLSVRKDLMPGMREVTFNSRSPVGSNFGVGQIAICDSTLGDVKLSLSKPVNNARGFAALVKQLAANNVVLAPAGTNALVASIRINQASSKSYAGIGLYWLFFDGNNWISS